MEYVKSINDTPVRVTILLVDDTSANIEVLDSVLSPEYCVKIALSGERALELAESPPRPDMILLDITMQGMDGYEVIRRLQSNPATVNIPVIFVTGKSSVSDEAKGLSLGAVDYITKPISPPIVRARVKTHLALYNQNRELERKVNIRTQQLQESKLEVISCLGRAAEFKDNETGMHVIRMSYYSRIIAESLNINSKWIDMMYNAAPMHDIGKIGIPDCILLKPGKLDTEAVEVMKRHVEYGVEILDGHKSEVLQMAMVIAETHHEKFDGSGYPNGLVGEDIPLAGRIVAISDVFDALTSTRPYKKAWDIDKAVAFIEEGAGKHFDPHLVKTFRQCLPKILDVKKHYGEV